MIKKNLIKFYDIGMPVLAIFSIILVVLDLTENINLDIPFYFLIDKGILIIFAIDYFARLFTSKSKWKFFKSNIFDLLAIIPFSETFSLFRFTRLFRLLRFFRLLRAIAFLGIIKKRLSTFLNTNGLIYSIYIIVAFISLGSVLIYFAEKGKNIKTLYDAVWWSIVTCTTVGYGDISPQTTEGRIIAVILMIFGIGFIGMFTSTITTYFMKNHHRNKTSDLTDLINQMSDHQIKAVMRYAEKVIDKDEEAHRNIKGAWYLMMLI